MNFVSRDEAYNGFTRRKNLVRELNSIVNTFVRGAVRNDHSCAEWCRHSVARSEARWCWRQDGRTMHVRNARRFGRKNNKPVIAVIEQR